MTEVHTTEVTAVLAEGKTSVLLEVLRLRGFVSGVGYCGLAGAITFEVMPSGNRKITQTITEEPKEEVLREAEKEFRKEVEVERVADYQGKQVGLGSNTEEVVEKLKAGKGLVEKIAGSLAEDNKDVFKEAGWEISKEPEIEFQKVWRIEDTEVVPQDMEVLMEVLISKGARHTESKLDGIVGYDFQEGYVVVVQTVLEV